MPNFSSIIKRTAYCKHANRLFSLVLAGALGILAITNSYLVAQSDTIAEMEQQERETQAAISSLEKQTKETQAALNSLQQQRQDSENTASSLQAQSNSLRGTYNEYSNQLDSINSEISSTEEKLAQTSSEIMQLNDELNENNRLRQELYEKLKKQIQTSYESKSNSSLIMTLLQSSGIKDFLNRKEYISSIVRYQQKLLSQYADTKARLEEETVILQAKESELDSYQSSLDKKQDALSNLAYDVMSELSETNSSLKDEKAKIANFENQMKELDKQMKALESQVAAAQAKLAQQIAARLAAQEAAGKKENTAGAYSASDNELVWLAATIQAEAGGESYTGKLAVGTVIMNRVMSSSFPNSIQGVITQNMQFASYRSGKVELYINRGPNSSCMQAAQEVLNGYRVGDYLFFMTKKYADYYRIADYTMIGNHAFFYKWQTLPDVPVVEETPAEAPSAPTESTPSEGSSTDAAPAEGEAVAETAPEGDAEGGSEGSE